MTRLFNLRFNVQFPQDAHLLTDLFFIKEFLVNISPEANP